MKLHYHRAPLLINNFPFHIINDYSILILVSIWIHALPSPGIFTHLVQISQLPSAVLPFALEASQ